MIEMSSDRPAQKVAHPVRGFVVAFFLGPPMFVCGAVAALALLDVVVSGWIPSRMLSDNAADWFFGLGIEGSAGAFARFMVSGLIAYACYAGIGWGFNGRRQPPSHQ